MKIATAIFIATWSSDRWAAGAMAQSGHYPGTTSSCDKNRSRDEYRSCDVQYSLRSINIATFAFLLYFLQTSFWLRHSVQNVRRLRSMDKWRYLQRPHRRTLRTYNTRQSTLSNGIACRKKCRSPSRCSYVNFFLFTILGWIQPVEICLRSEWNVSNRYSKLLVGVRLFSPLFLGPATILFYIQYIRQKMQKGRLHRLVVIHI
jgi:hypothetical protein